MEETLKPEIEEAYLKILEEELKPATGCTEPIAIAYAAARLRKLLGSEPTKIVAEVSGNIIKNVKSVVVPNTGNMRGIAAAIAAGIVAGDPEKELQVMGAIRPEDRVDIKTYADNTPIEVVCADTPRLLDIHLIGFSADGHSAEVHIANNHANVVEEKRDDAFVFQKEYSDSAEDALTDKSCLNVADILTFANTIDTETLLPLIGPQIDLNLAIAAEGMKNEWGANIGKVIDADFASDFRTEMRSWAAAGSDARMSGCEMPVVILSGSGNQGITASVPVALLAKHLGTSRGDLLRAVALSDLVAIEQKRGIGRLSAYCGAVSAGVGAGAAMAYLMDGSFRAIAHTIVNALAIISGTICDGAKPSCAAKIAASVDAGIMGYAMYAHHQQFLSGDGIITKGVDNTIENIGTLAHDGMRETDKTILSIMTRNC